MRDAKESYGVKVILKMKNVKAMTVHQITERDGMVILSLDPIVRDEKEKL